MDATTTPQHPSTRTNLEATCTADAAGVVVEVVVPDQDTPTPCALVVVIDTSHSMIFRAPLPGKPYNDACWSRLQVVQQAVLALIAALGESDYVHVLTFDTVVKTLHGWVKCTAENKHTLSELVRGVRAVGSTNLHAALVKCYEAMRCMPSALQAQINAYALNVALLTDGRPTFHHVANDPCYYTRLVSTLSNEVHAAVGRRPHLTTIAVGDDCDAGTLTNVAHLFQHMPHPGAVAQNMVNFAAHVRATASVGGVALSNVALRSSTPFRVPGAPNAPSLTAVASVGIETSCVPLGLLARGTTRSVFVYANAAFDERSVWVEVDGRRLEGVTVTATSAAARVRREEARAAAVQKLHGLPPAPKSSDASATLIESDLATKRDDLAAFVATLEQDGLRTTLQTEVLQALNDMPKWRTWGHPYAKALASALWTERRTNFLDEALQHFVGVPEERYANDVEDAWSTVLAPPPAYPAGHAYPARLPLATYVDAPQRQSTEPSAATAFATPKCMPDEFMRGGGCFAADSAVLCAKDGAPQPKKVSDVRCGDQIITSRGLVAVECVVENYTTTGQLVKLKPRGARFTVWHPVKWCEEWRFANEVDGAQLQPCGDHESVYNFVMVTRDALPYVGGFYGVAAVDYVVAAPLGHGLKGSAVVEHEFWGARVVDVLKQAKGWKEGFVVVERP